MVNFQNVENTETTHWSDDRVIGEMLRHLRVAQRVSQSRIAEALNLPQTVISRIERGERHVTLRELRLVCALLDKSPLDFVAEYIQRMNASSPK